MPNHGSGRTRTPWRTLLAIAFLLPATAWAQMAFTTQTVNLRAGPDRSFPLVTWVPAGTQVNVIGCINGWTWCDVIAGFNRGWVFAQFLSMPFQNQPILIGNAGSWLGVPLISFSVGPYWDIHYRNRPWWNQRNHWVGRPPHNSWGPPSSRPPPRPQPRPPVSQPRPPRPQPPIAQPPIVRPPSGGRPPDGGRPPSSGNPGGGRPPSGGNPGGGRPPSGGNPGGGRPPGGGNPGSGGGRPPPGSVSSQGPQ